MSNNGIFDKNYDDYLKDVKMEVVNEESIFINDKDDADSFANKYGDDIVDFFSDGEYSNSDDGKIRAVKDFMRRNNININLDYDVDWLDIIEEIDWNQFQPVSEEIIDKVEDMVESMQDFIREYRRDENYMPNMKVVVFKWIEELEEMLEIVE